MATSDNLEASGMLYGSNWEEWKMRMIAILCVHGIEVRRDAYSLHRPVGLDCSEQQWDQRSREAITLTRAFVNPSLFERIPPEERDNFIRVIKRLREFSLSFRFLDLPAELRTRIYGYTLPNTKIIIVRPNTSRAAIPQQPAITKVSRQLREESLPMFYSRSTFSLQFIAITKVDGIRLPLESWAGRIPRSNWKYLKSVYLRFRIQKFSTTFHVPLSTVIGFEFSADDGLRVTYGDDLMPSSKLLLDIHVALVQERYKGLGMQNDAIMQALISNPKLWEMAIACADARSSIESTEYLLRSGKLKKSNLEDSELSKEFLVFRLTAKAS